MDTESLAQLIDRYGNMVLRLAYTYLKNKADAEDIVQDVFLQVMEKQPEFQNAEHEKAWLVRTTINHCKNRLHTFWNRNKCSIDEIAEISKCDTYQLDSDVLKAVLSLPAKYRTAVYMHYYEGYKTPEFARFFGTSETTVRSWLCRARAKLKDMLKEEYDFE